MLTDDKMVIIMNEKGGEDMDAKDKAKLKPEAERLVALRHKLGHTQTTLGQALGLSLRQVIRYENCETPIPAMLWLAMKSVNSYKRTVKE